jgi:hypothetical protein
MNRLSKIHDLVHNTGVILLFYLNEHAPLIPALLELRNSHGLSKTAHSNLEKSYEDNRTTEIKPKQKNHEKDRNEAKLLDE